MRCAAPTPAEPAPAGSPQGSFGKETPGACVWCVLPTHMHVCVLYACVCVHVRVRVCVCACMCAGVCNVDVWVSAHVCWFVLWVSLCSVSTIAKP